MKKIRNYACVILMLLMLSACVKELPEYRKCNGAVWGTTFHITYNSDKDLADSIMLTLKVVERSLSPFDSTSLISKINRNESFETDSMFRYVFEASQKICKVSGGAFDPTLAPLINMWGFGYKTNDKLPTSMEVDSAMSLVGILDCSIENNCMIKKHPLSEFNFSAITKGFGCDEIAKMLRRNGCVDYMIEIGGEIAIGGKNPKGEFWRIMIDAPRQNAKIESHEKMVVIEIDKPCGVATSGNYRNYRETANGVIGHTINAQTGYPVSSSILSATIIAPSAMIADALATACMAMSEDSALSMIEKYPGVEALLVSKLDADSIFVLKKTSYFPECK